MVLSLTSDVLQKGQLYDLASTILSQSLSQVPGVGEVQIGGSSLPAVRIELERRWLHTARKRLLSIEGVRPFVVQNLGKYERQLWQTAEFEAHAKSRSREGGKESPLCPMRLGRASRESCRCRHQRHGDSAAAVP